jgi:hypothetical protein
MTSPNDDEILENGPDNIFQSSIQMNALCGSAALSEGN